MAKLTQIESLGDLKLGLVRNNNGKEFTIAGFPFNKAIEYRQAAIRRGTLPCECSSSSFVLCFNRGKIVKPPIKWVVKGDQLGANQQLLPSLCGDGMPTLRVM